MKYRMISVLLLLSLLLTACGGTETAEESAAPSQSAVSASRLRDTARRYHAILSGSDTFYSVDAGQALTVEQLSLAVSEDGAAAVKVSAFAVSDLDGDGEDEVLLWLIVDTNHAYGYAVLHHEGNTVYGYIVRHSSLVDLRVDGTFSFYGSAAKRGSASMSFTDRGCSLEKITYCWDTSYYVDGQGATEEEFSQGLALQSGKTRALWHYFTDTNIQAQLET